MVGLNLAESEIKVSWYQRLVTLLIKKMGAAKSKVRKLSPRTILELQRNLDVDFTREEIEEWYNEYQATLVR